MPTSLHRAAVASSSLPDGSSFTPPWRASEDVYLCDGFQMVSMNVFDCPGLGATKFDSEEEACDKFEEIVLFLSKSRPESARNEDELIRRFHQLRDAYGPEHDGFQRFRRDSKAAKDAEERSGSSPDIARSGKRERDSSPGSASFLDPTPCRPSALSSGAASAARSARPTPTATSVDSAARASASRSASSLGKTPASSVGSSGAAASRPERGRAAAATPTAAATPAAQPARGAEEESEDDECPTGGRPVAGPKRLRSASIGSAVSSRMAYTPSPALGASAAAAAGSASHARLGGGASGSSLSLATNSTAGLTASAGGRRPSACLASGSLPSCPTFASTLSYSSGATASAPGARQLPLLPPTPANHASSAFVGTGGAPDSRAAPPGSACSAAGGASASSASRGHGVNRARPPSSAHSSLSTPRVSTPGSASSSMGSSAASPNAFTVATSKDPKLAAIVERRDSARANANAVGALGSRTLREWARASVLANLNARAGISTLHDTLNAAADGPRAAVHTEMRDLLSRTLDGIENVSTLLVGPRGSGKHRLLSSVLRQLSEGDAAGGRGNNDGSWEGEGFLRVDLHPMLVEDEPKALMAIASQLRVMHGGLALKGSFCDGLRYILHLLRRARPGAAGDAAIEGQSQPVVFVLHAFEMFCARPKQTLLYSLFDLMQTEDAQMAVVGLTTRIDVADLLEKRVRSRCGHRQMWLPALDHPADCARLMKSSLALPAVAVGDSPTASDTPEKAKRFCEAWAAQVALLCAQLPYSSDLRRRLSIGVTPTQLQTAVRLAITDLGTPSPERHSKRAAAEASGAGGGASPSKPADRNLLYLGMLEAALKLMMVPRDELLLCELTAVELLILLCLKKLADKEYPPPHTLKMSLREYGVFVAGCDNNKFDYPKPLLVASFEHLCSLGLIITVRERGSRALPTEQLPLRLGTDAHTLHDFVKSHKELPLDVRRFGTNVTI